MKNRYLKLYLTGLLPLLVSFPAIGQNSYTFTTAGATGQYGPTQGQVNAAYVGTSLDGSVVVTGGIQSFTVPVTSQYSVLAAGAGGGDANSFGGRGRIVSGVATLSAGTVLNVLVGQKGIKVFGSSGGGGGSFIALTGNTPFLVGGGGAGFLGSIFSSIPSSDGNIGQNGFNSLCATGTGGNNGNGGTGTTGGWGGGGGGFYTNGTAASACAGTGGTAFVNGGFGAGTCYTTQGGFGGGGGTHGNTGGGGGGGGYSGGGGSHQSINPNTGGGGGSFFHASFTQTTDVGFNLNDGYVTITQLCNNVPTAPTDNTQVNNYTVCPGNTTTLSAVGSGSITWHPTNTSSVVLSIGNDVTTASTLAAGVYTYWAMNTNTCSSSPRTPVTFTVLTPPNVVVNAASPICYGYTVTLSASGANSYTWNGGPNTQSFNVVANSQYTVTGLDATTGCTNTGVSTMTIIPTPTVVVTGPSTVCAGSQATLNVSGADNYFWSNGTNGPTVSLTVLTNTALNVVGTYSSNGCASTVQHSINAMPVPNLTVTGATTLCANSGNSLTLTASGANDYYWSNGATTSSIVVSPNASVNYSLVGVLNTGCTSTLSVPVSVISCVGLGENSNAASLIKVYPNPAATEISFDWTNGQSKIYELYDITGKVVLKGKSDDDKTTIQIASLASGVYYLKIQSGDVKETIKVQKQ